MSDDWYRKPAVLPPYEDDFGRLWAMDGTQVGGPPEVEPEWPEGWPEELRWHLLRADIVMSMREEYERQMETAMHDFLSGKFASLFGPWPDDPGLGLGAH